MSTGPTIALHLGAHKTATTHLQSRLTHSAEELLQQHRIRYIPLGMLRRRLTSRLGKLREAGPDFRRWWDSLQDCDRLVLSDENIIGSTAPPSGNQLYPAARHRTAALLEFLGPDTKVEVFFTVRDYGDYLASRYAESLLHFPFTTFDAYCSRIRLDAISWLDTLADIEAAGAPRPQVTAFEQLFGDEQGYFDLLLGKKGICLSPAGEDPATRRGKFSQQGYEVITHFAQTYGATDVAPLVKLLGDTRQQSPVTPFRPIDPALRQQLSQRYEAELAAWRARQPVAA